MKENMRRIHDMQKSAQQTDEETKQPVKALWKLSKFDSVPSRVKEQMQVVHFAFQQYAPLYKKWKWIFLNICC